MEERVVRARRKRPRYGPKKLWKMLRDEHGGKGLPALSTIAKILARRGLTGKRARRRRGQIVQLGSGALTQAGRPNEVWTGDFQGWFKSLDAGRCDPLTITHLYSHL